jgi:endogenous inhibitor of DNA gyrase (YacG/DUF329 family)
MSPKCPHCGKETSIDVRNPFRPFCSERCKLIDLGSWISGRYRIPVEYSEEDISQDSEPLKVPDKK